MNSRVPADTEKSGGAYRTLCGQMAALLERENDWVANLANAAALLADVLPHINWVGFYRLQGGELLLGPFQGKPACLHIALGKGVCGTAVRENATQLVPDVHRFSGHIACDAASVSELVIPLRRGGRVVGVLDIDSPVPGRFSGEEARALEKVAEILSPKCTWPDSLG